MKKTFKGFTLIECIVALAILGVASLTMAQIYAAVSTRNKMNHLVNTSLSNQMAYVEKYTNSESVEITYGNGAAAATSTPPHKTSVGQNDNYLTVTKNVTGTAATADEYSFPVDVYVLKSRDRDNNTLNKTKTEVAGGDVGNTAGYGESDYNLRYKYLLGHTS